MPITLHLSSRWANDCPISHVGEKRHDYPTSRGFSLAWLLAFNEVVRVVYLVCLYPVTGGKQTNYATEKPRKRLRQRQKPCKRSEKSLLPGYATTRRNLRRKIQSWSSDCASNAHLLADDSWVVSGNRMWYLKANFTSSNGVNGYKGSYNTIS